MVKWRKLWWEEEGQAFSEYALIISLIAAALVLSLVLFKDKIKPLYENTRFTGT